MITRQTVPWFVAGLMLFCSLAHGATVQDELPWPTPLTEQGRGPVIDIWYGPFQAFGMIGTPMNMSNVLGKAWAPSGIAGLYYSLNGAAEVPLSIGPDGLRLARSGDFNVELDNDEVLDGLNDLVIRAVDFEGHETTTQVVVTYTDGTVWPDDYTIDWSTVTALQDVAQVIDGLWALDEEGVRPLETDYDRLIAIGDRTWENYEVEVPIRIIGIDPRAYEPRNKGAAVGILLRWPGHADWDGQRPHSGWWPHGAIGLLKWTGIETDLVTSIQIFGDQKKPWILADKPRPIVLGTTYMYKMRAQTRRADGVVIGTSYRLKIWDQGQPEPKNWELTVTEGTDDPQFGPLVLLSHFVDCVFGNVKVVPLSSR